MMSHRTAERTVPSEPTGVGDTHLPSDGPAVREPELPRDPEDQGPHPWHSALEPGFALDERGAPRTRYAKALSSRAAYPLAHALADRLIGLYVPQQHRSGKPWQANLPYTLCTHHAMSRCHTVIRHGRAFPVQPIHDRGLWLRQVLGTQGPSVYADMPEHRHLFLDVDVRSDGDVPFHDLPAAERRRVVRAVTFAARRVLGDLDLHVLDSRSGGFWLQCWFEQPGTPDDLRHVLNALRNRIWFTCEVVGRSVLPGGRRWPWPHLTLDVDPLSENGCRTWGSPSPGTPCGSSDSALPLADTPTP